jgi:hypothetical protein
VKTPSRGGVAGLNQRKMQRIRNRFSDISPTMLPREGVFTPRFVLFLGFCIRFSRCFWDFA